MFGRYVVVLAVSVVLVACGDRKAVRAQMDKADSLMQCHPDSALAILQGINASEVSGKKDKARYALLTSMALDKNYIDTTEFDVLQPAIDYYLEHGTPDERLRTYYYQGRIYNNREEDDSAMSCFLRAAELKGEVTDTLTLAHTLVAQGTLCVNQYMPNGFVQNNIQAAHLYEAIGKDVFAIKSYTKAINGYLIEEKRSFVDSLLNICVLRAQKIPNGEDYLFPTLLSYVIEYGTHEELKNFLDEHCDKKLDFDDGIDFARGYLKIGEYDKAMNRVLDIRPTSSVMDSLKYNLVKINILEKQGKYEQAFKELMVYAEMVDRQMNSIFLHDVQFAEKKHQLEMEHLIKLRARDKIIWGTITGMLVLIIFAGWLCYHVHLLKTNHKLTERENENLKLQQDGLRRDKEMAELERDKRALEAENLTLIIEQLENEREELGNLQRERSELAKPIQEAIKMRLNMLNGLMAMEITHNDSYAKSYNQLIKSVHNDKKKFMDSTRVAFAASHPFFMDYLEQHGLTIDEINIVCLYAMGLRGKEVGEYMQLKRHYVISSEIRKKLGIGEHETNLGPYVRSLMKDLE